MNEHETSEYIRANSVPRDHRAGSIYFVTCDHPKFPIKIGFASKLKPRITGLKVVMPYPVMLLASMPGSRRTERGLHHHFKVLRLCGEWFKRDAAILRAIERIKAEEQPFEDSPALLGHVQSLLARAHLF